MLICLDMFITPAAKSNDSVSRGRGSGGLVTMWNKRLTKYVSKVSSNNFRLLATKFSLPDWDLLLINVYFPCDPRTENFDDTELITLLADMRSIIERSQCFNVLLAGDLNAHFDRSTRFTRTVRAELDDLELILLWDQPETRVDYTYCCIQNNLAYFSTLDHFAMNSRLLNTVLDG